MDNIKYKTDNAILALLLQQQELEEVKQEVGLVSNGDEYETHAGKFFTTDDLITLRDKATVGLGSTKFTGLVAKKYDGLNDGQLVFDADGYARVGDEDSLQMIATRENAPTDKGIAYYDETTRSFKTKAESSLSVAQAVNANKLASVAATNYARTDTSETFSEPVTFKKNIVGKGVAEFYSPETGKTDRRLTLNNNTADQTSIYNYAEETADMKALLLGHSNPVNGLLLDSSNTNMYWKNRTVWDSGNSNLPNVDWTVKDLRAHGNLIVNENAIFDKLIQLNNDQSIQGKINGQPYYGNMLAMGTDNYAEVANSSNTEGVKLYSKGNQLKLTVNGTGSKTHGDHTVTGEVIIDTTRLANGVLSLNSNVWLRHTAGANEGWEIVTDGAKDIEILRGIGIINHRDTALKGTIGTAPYISGIGGKGTWRISQDANAEFDNLDIREGLTCNTFTNNKINISNGDLIVSDTDTIEYVDGNILYFSKEQPFRVGDVLRCQGSSSPGNIKSYYITVASEGTSQSRTDEEGVLMKFITFTDKTGSGTIETDDILLRWNSSDTDRKGLLYMSSSSTYAPFYDVIYDGQTKARYGRLDGITTSTGKVLSGYGSWAQNGYFEGWLNAKEGLIGGISLSESRLSTSAYFLDKDGTASFANGAAVFNADGRVVFGNHVSLDWSQVSNTENIASKSYATEEARLARLEAEANAAEDAQTKATTALNAAKLDATNKANKAEEDAITAANTKAEAETVKAKAYADGIVTEAEQRAIDDATTKANNAEAAAISSAEVDATAKANAAEAAAISSAATDAATKATNAKNSAISTAALDAKTKADKALADAKLHTGGLIGSKLTKIGATGIYTGILSADQILATGIKVGTGGIQLDSSAVIAWGNVTGTSGVETTTGSQAKADAAQNAATDVANAAQSTANTANSTANTAKTNAATAQSTANSATTKANTAQSTADTGVTKANAAQSTANTANSTANTAKTNAATAQSTANSATTKANTAQSTADTGVTKANAAQSTANTGVANAATALSEAKAARKNLVAHPYSYRSWGASTDFSPHIGSYGGTQNNATVITPENYYSGQSRFNSRWTMVTRGDGAGTNTWAGGFTFGNNITYDREQTYMFAMWVYKTTTSGQVLFGTGGKVYSLTGTANTNHYFRWGGTGDFTGTSTIEAGWQLWVAYVRGKGTKSGAANMGAMYDANGYYIGSLTDCRFGDDTTLSYARVGFYHGASGYMMIQQSQVYACDGSEPSIADLLGTDPTILTKITEDTIETTSVTANNLKVKSANVSGKLRANQIETGQITSLGAVTAGTFSLGNGKFKVDANGKLTATDATINGIITSKSGKIANWDITDKVLYYNGNIIGTGTYSIALGSKHDAYGSRGGFGLSFYRDDGTVSSGMVKTIQIGQVTNKDSINDYSSNHHGINVGIKGGKSIFRIADDGNWLAGFKFNENLIQSEVEVEPGKFNKLIFDSSNGEIRVQDSNYSASVISADGILSNHANTQCISATTGMDWKASITALGFGNKTRDSYIPGRNMLCGLYAAVSNSASASQRAPSYAAYLNGAVYSQMQMGGALCSSTLGFTTSNSGTELKPFQNTSHRYNTYYCTATSGSKLYVKLPRSYSPTQKIPDGTIIRIGTQGRDIGIVADYYSRLRWDSDTARTSGTYTIGAENDWIQWILLNGAWTRLTSGNY